MKIAEIRRVIESAQWSRNDLSGATRDEFRRMDVATRLGKHIEALRALVIHPRFALDIEHRNDEIVRCSIVIERWNDAQTPGTVRDAQGLAA